MTAAGEAEGLRDALRQKDAEIEAISSELESTNRGVVALYAELDDQAAQLRQASELKSRFLSHMSHEFRTPLNSILAISRLLLDRMDGELTAEQERQVGYIRGSAQSLTELINDLLDIAKVEAGKTDVRCEVFSAAGLLATLRGVLRPLQTNGRVELLFENADAIPPIRSDEGKVSQILRNLISNALKYTEAGEVRVATAYDPATDLVHFSVADTGVGIAPDDQERVFQEFVQIENALQGRVRGTGLGLPLSQRLAGLLGGELTLASQSGRGSTFTLAIPAGRDRPNEGDAGPILAIDDEATARYVLRQCLGVEPTGMLEAEDGERGLAMARAHGPALIFLDLHLPGISGFDVLERLAADPATAGIPVVVVTSSLLDAAAHHRLARARAILSKAELDRDGVRALVSQLAPRAGHRLGVS